jgi:hypothetical protein
VYREKIEICEQTRKTTFNLNVQLNGSAINLLASRDEATLGPSRRQRTVAMVGPDAIGYSTVTNCHRQRHFPSTLRKTPEESAATIIDNVILDALKKPPFSSIRELAQPSCIPRSTVHRHLTQSLGFGVTHLRWVPQPTGGPKSSAHHSLK